MTSLRRSGTPPTPPMPSTPSTSARTTPAQTGPRPASYFYQLRQRTPRHRGIPRAVSPGCDVRLQVFRGEAGLLQFHNLISKAPDHEKYIGTRLCRGDVGWSYIADHLKNTATAPRVFALAAVSKTTGHVMGFALIKVYAPGRRVLYSPRGQAPVTIPINRRTAMLDLICTRDDCKGLGGLLVAAIKSECRKLNVELLMLEATSKAAGYYILLGFRRVPDACSLVRPRDVNEVARVKMQVAQARMAFQRHPFTRDDRFRNKAANGSAVPSLVDAASMNTVTGPVWYPGYNRGGREDGNYTVIMSLCIRGKNDSRTYTGADPKARLFKETLKFDPLGVRRHVNEGKRWQTGDLFTNQHAAVATITSAPYFKPFSPTPPKPSTPTRVSKRKRAPSADVATAAAQQVRRSPRARRA